MPERTALAGLDMTLKALPAEVKHRVITDGPALAKLTDMLGDLAVNVLIASGIFVATLWVAKWTSGLMRRALQRLPRTAADKTLQDFASSVVRYAVVIIGVVAILRRLGVETTSIITILGAASLAIGLALQGALSNVAAGVMILLFRPYRVGDVVTIATKLGTVRRMDLFNTEMLDPDGLKIVVPNGKAFGDVVTNYSDIPYRRVEMTFALTPDADADAAAASAMAVLLADKRVLDDPAPMARPTEYTAEKITLTVRAWAKVDDYWDMRFDLSKLVSQAVLSTGSKLYYPTTRSVSLTVPTHPAADPAGIASRP
jgi:small conductance mechanosensitive channel